MLRLSLIAAAVLSATAAMAQESKEIQKIEVKGAAQAYNPRRDDTASKIIVSSEEIKRYGDTSIGDALKRVPGVSVGAGGRDIRLRGLGNGYTQILLNGEKAPAGFNIESIAPDNIERIEVIRAASAEFSTQAIAGTINIVLKKAVQVAQREFKTGAGRASDFHNVFANLQLSDKEGNFSYSVNANAWKVFFNRHNESDDTLVAPTGALLMRHRTLLHDHGQPRGVDLSPRLNWTLDNGDTLTSQSFINHNVFRSAIERQIDTLAGQPLHYDGIGVGNLSRNSFARSDLTWVHKFGEGAKLDAKIGGQAMRSNGTWRERDDQGGQPALQHDVFSGVREQGMSSTGKYSQPLLTDHALAVGWDIGYANRRDWRDQRDTYLATQTPDNKDEGYAARVRRAAVYAQDEWNLKPNWSVYAGMRWEGIQTRSSGAGFAPVDSRSSVWSPLLQTLYKLANGKDQLRAALTRTYKAPQTGNLSGRRFTSTNNTQTDPDWIGNPHLKPELSTGFDASYEHYWGEGGLLSAAVATRNIDNFTRRSVLLDDTGRWVSTLTNNGHATVRSLDLEAKFPLKAVMEGAPNLDLRANVSRNWSRVDAVPGPHNRLDQQVPLTANLGADYKTPDGVWSLGGSLNLKAGGLVRVDSNQTSYSLMTRSLEMYLVWKMDQQTQLRLSGWNLLGQDFYSVSSFDTAEGTLSSTSNQPGYRGVRLQLERRF